ncbi:MAG: penicillin-binding transpeptidase domain-containing protein [Nocardioides sp.]
MRSRRTLLAALVLLAATGCTGDEGEQPEEAADTLAGALTKGKLAPARFLDTEDKAAQKWWRATTDGMRDSEVEVTVDEVTEDDSGDAATATLGFTWILAGTEETWSHEGTARLVRGEDDLWRVRLEPGLLDLEEGERLDLATETAPRAAILGAGDQEIVTDRPVLRFGVDKAQVPPSRQAAAARDLARLVDVDADDLVERVKAAGDKAFVEAIVLREADATRALAGAAELEGVGVLDDTLPLAPTREFARPILGSVGAVTAEIIEESDGAYEIGDEAGLSGLQQRYDERLRGTPGLAVRAVGAPADEPRGLHRVEPVVGEPLRTTLDLDLQADAENILAGVGPASAIVAVRPSTGDIVAAASGPGGGGLSTATVGQYAPGSTFKVVSSLALLRAGLSPSSPVDCPRTTVVDGKTFKNYDDYPAGGLGRITLRQAVANSCNTAFITQRERVDELPAAAAALGLGVDHDLGFPAYFGSVPEPESETSHAASLIGQGQVLASPIAMAALVASVVEGSTVVPRLLPDQETDGNDVRDPLTANEATVLRGLMRAVVIEGSGSQLADVPGPPVIAKTGTAEFGDAEPLQTHTWMVAGQGDLAVAVFVDVGESGSRTAGPLLERFLRAAR